MAGEISTVLFSEAFKLTCPTAGSAGSGSAGAVFQNAYYPTSGSFLSAGDFGATAFLVTLGDLADAVDFEVYQSTTSGSTGAKAVTGASKTDVAATDDGKMFTIEVGSDQLDLANAFRYLTLKVSGVSGANYGNIVALQFKPRYQPVTQSTTLFLEAVKVV